MDRRQLVQGLAALPLASAAGRAVPALAQEPFRRVRPGDAAWPAPEHWDALRREVGDALLAVRSPLDSCRDPGCGARAGRLTNPYFIGDEAALTQTSGWLDAWSPAPSVYAVQARDARDVAAAVNFARTHRLRLAIKGGGHSYQGTSSAPDSLLIWTRRMNAVTLHDAFVPQGCERMPAQPAVSVGAGAMWGAVYDAVTTRAGRYVQGGGCLSVGVAGLIQSGGFGSFSKAYGLAAAGLLEAEIVTADGRVRLVNACTDPDLFWAIKGGGGGSFGVITRVTLRTRALPETFGAVAGSIKAPSDGAFRTLIARVLQFYREQLFNPHWGEQIIFDRPNTVSFVVLFQDVDQQQAEGLWRPFIDTLTAAGFSVNAPFSFVALPSRRLWDFDYLRSTYPQLLVADDRPGAPRTNVSWAGDAREAGRVIHAFRSAWLPAVLLREDRLAELADALFAATRSWRVSLHLNKGLAGAPLADIEAARDTAINPAVLDAFALAIIGGSGVAALPGGAATAAELASARERAAAIRAAMDALLRVAPQAGSYVSESDYFEPDWQHAFWGANYPRLAAVKQAHDPDGLFFVHHGVGSEQWSADGFTRRRG